MTVCVARNATISDVGLNEAITEPEPVNLQQMPSINGRYQAAGLAVWRVASGSVFPAYKRREFRPADLSDQAD